MQGLGWERWLGEENKQCGYGVALTHPCLVLYTRLAALLLHCTGTESYGRGFYILPGQYKPLCALLHVPAERQNCVYYALRCCSHTSTLMIQEAM